MTNALAADEVWCAALVAVCDAQGAGLGAIAGLSAWHIPDLCRFTHRLRSRTVPRSFTGDRETITVNPVGPHLGRRVLEFIDATEVVSLPQQVMALFEAAVGELGFRAYIMAGISTSDVSRDRVTRANGWPMLRWRRAC